MLFVNIVYAGNGDIDNSGDLDLKDVISALKICSGDSIIIGTNISNIDINNNLKIDLAEAIYVLQFISNLRDIVILPTGYFGKTEDYDYDFESFTSSFVTQASQNLPSRYDWREHNVVTPAKNQGSCGSCWAFAVAGAFESKILMKGGNSFDLSEQQLISFISPGANKTCAICDQNRTQFISPYLCGCCGGNFSSLTFWYDRGPMIDDCTGYGDFSYDYSQLSCDCEGGFKKNRSNVTADSISDCPILPYRVKEPYTLVEPNNINAMKISLKEYGPAPFAYVVYNDL